jgi:3-hydroxyisobutyrate dehydrogenase
MLSTSVIGLGNMGLGMATTLLGKGFSVSVSDLSHERLAMAGEAGADVGADAGQADVIVLSLPLAEHVAGVVDGPRGLAARAAPGSVIVDTSTSEAAVSRRLAELCAKRGVGFLDAPVSGGPAGARSGQLTMMIGGDAAHVEAARPALEAVAAMIIHVGASGAGNVAKLVNNLLVAAHLLTVSEAMRLSEAAGVPTDDVLKVVNAASGRSAVSEVNYPRWIANGAFDSGFTMGLMRKDVRLAAALAAESGVSLPVSGQIAKLWAESAANLPDSEDFNRIVTLAAKA